MGVLLVDDNPEVQDLVALTLQESGLSVTSVNDGLSALDLAISEKPDLILADFSVKGIDIGTFVKKIQRREYLAKTPIVFLLPKEAEFDPFASQFAEHHVILKKPIDPILLLKEVKKQMGIVEEEEEPAYLPITEEILSEKPAALFQEEEEGEGLSFDLLKPLETEPTLQGMEQVWQGHSKVSDQEEKVSSKADVDSEKVEETIRKVVLEVVERVAWEILPGVIDTAVPKRTIQSLVEQVVWEIVPPLAEIEIKKEIKRLQPDSGFSV